jgi:hypothetical protein
MLKLKFVLSEIKRFFSSVPQMILFIITLTSASLLYTSQQISEVNHAILEGIISGYIFYLFVDVLPKSEKRASSAKKIAKELASILTNIHTLKSSVKDEVLASDHQPQNQNNFFDLLEKTNSSHMPTTNNMKRIKSVTPPTATQPIQFHYSNFEEVLYGELTRLIKKLESFERSSTIYGLADLDEELMRLVSDLPTRPLASSMIPSLRHISNIPAIFGSDIDLIEKSLLEIKFKLESDWKIKFN